MAADLDGVICANRLCKVAEDGKCVEGLEFAKCPYFGREPTEEELQADEKLAVQQDTFDGVRLPDAHALDTARADRHLGLLPSRMIGIVGAYDSGKTCVIAGLYDLFQKGSVAGNHFAGSSTLHGFELICHDARVTSGRKAAHSARTGRGEVRFYHLDVRHEPGLVSLLIADRSGEEYEEIADVAANASGMIELMRADVLTILVDGRRLSSSVDRADAIGAIPMIVQGMVEKGALARRPDLAVVLTKKDVVVGSGKMDRVMRDFAKIVDGLNERFPACFRETRSFVTCASPKATAVERGLGLPELLDFWMRRPIPGRIEPRRYRSGRVFDVLEVGAGDDD